MSPVAESTRVRGSTRMGGSTRVGEAAVYGFLTLLGLAAAVVGVGYGVVTAQGRVGLGLVPSVSAGLLALLGALLLVRHLRAGPRPSPPQPKAADEPDLFGRTERERVRHLWVVFGLLLLTVLAVPFLGFLGAFGAFVFVVSAWVEKRRVLPSAVIAAVACGFIWVVFVMFLRVPLPLGVFGV